MKYHVEFDLDFKRNPYKGMYIAVEGIDGSGKSTQVESLKEYFEKSGKTVTQTSEPKRDLIVGRLIHEALKAKIDIPAPALQYLYSADRVINHESVVKPSLEKGDIVLSHRVFWSVIPYGIMDIGQDTYSKDNTEVLFVAQGLLSMYHQFIVPDVTFYLDISVDTAMRRLSQMDKQKEIYEKREKLERILRGYRWLVKEFPKEFVIINGEQSEENITEEIIEYINSHNAKV